MRKILMVMLGAIAAVVFLLWWGSQIVNEDEIALRYRWGHLDSEPLASGFHVLWPGYSLVVFDNTKHFISMDETDPEEGVLGIGSQTKEKYVLGVVIKLEYQINPKLAVKLLRGYGRQDGAETRKKIEERIRAEVAMAVRQATPEYTMEDLINKRNLLQQIIVYRLGPSSEKPSPAIVSMALSNKPATTVADIGVEVTPISIAYSVPNEYKRAQLKRTEMAGLEAERSFKEVEAKNQEIELANAKRQREIDGINAEANANSRRSTTLGLAVQKWNGALPETILLGNESFEIIRKLGIEKPVAPSAKRQ